MIRTVTLLFAAALLTVCAPDSSSSDRQLSEAPRENVGILPVPGGR